MAFKQVNTVEASEAITRNRIEHCRGKHYARRAVQRRVTGLFEE